jgi:GAF domain-containing protein
MTQHDEIAATPESSDRLELERTLEALRQNSEVAHVLLGLAGALAEVRTVEETLERAVGIVPDLFGADRGLAATWDPRRQRFAIAATRGFPVDPVRPFESDPLALLRRALTEGTPLLLSDPEGIGERPGEEVGSLVVIPLTRWGEELGGLQLEFARRREFSSKEVSLARGVARQLGTALSNSRRFSLMRDLRAFGLRLGSKLLLPAVIDEVCADAAELLSGDAAALYFVDASSRSLVRAGGAGATPGRDSIGRIEIGRPPWSDLLTDHIVTVPDLRAVMGRADAPVGAVGIALPESAGSFSAFDSRAPLGDRLAGVFGAILVFFERAFVLGPDEAEALRVLAAQSGTALRNAQRYERQRRVADSLQQGLLSIEVPAMLGGWEVGAVYEPAGAGAEVGGDFFDAFDVGGGRVAISVGDVSGKGAEAAAGTAMAKYMLRAFAMRNPAPTSVLYHLNNALVQSFDDDRFTTLLYAVFHPDSGLCQVCVGGHPPPLIYRAGTAAIESVPVEGPILGAFEDQRFEQQVVHLGAGDVLLVYTDGLAEARNGGALYGREEIAASLGRHARVPGGAERVARSLF